MFFNLIIYGVTFACATAQLQPSTAKNPDGSNNNDGNYIRVSFVVNAPDGSRRLVSYSVEPSVQVEARPYQPFVTSFSNVPLESITRPKIIKGTDKVTSRINYVQDIDNKKPEENIQNYRISDDDNEGGLIIGSRINDDLESDISEISNQDRNKLNASLQLDKTTVIDNSGPIKFVRRPVKGSPYTKIFPIFNKNYKIKSIPEFNDVQDSDKKRTGPIYYVRRPVKGSPYGKIYPVFNKNFEVNTEAVTQNYEDATKQSREPITYVRRPVKGSYYTRIFPVFNKNH